MNSIPSLLAKEHELHRALNAARVPADLEAQYAALRERQAPFSGALLDHLTVPGYSVDLHDVRVVGFTEKRKGQLRQVRFSMTARAYDLDECGGEVGYAQVIMALNIPVATSLRPLSNLVIHTALLDQDTQTIGFLAHPNTGVMSTIVAQYASLDIQVGPFQTWGELVQKERAVGPWRRATLQVMVPQGSLDFHARWYDNGYLEVAKQSVPDEEFELEVAQGLDRWQDYGEFAAEFYTDLYPDVVGVYVQVGEERVAVSANANRHGMYAPKPIDQRVQVNKNLKI